ncbi:hypothetical protein [Nitratireductor arenosus]|uniref:hypothetical protein n=1 Tax=Nitratireductor arenosus TaxID=2682096 RepID=UPI001FE866CB|nr:hypothetical protein [Nitratireductor arenosus]
MSGFSTSEFATLLDELIAAKADESEAECAGPSVPFGFVPSSEAVEELWANVPGEVVASLYRRTGLESLAENAPGIETPDPPEEPLPPADPAAIAAELKIAYARWPKDFDRIRREFARDNHPDKVAPDRRERALARMQIANMLIDRAKRNAAAKR